MTYPIYKNSKESRVNWLGKIPGDWRVSRFRHIVSTHKGKAPDELFDSQSTPDQVPYLTMDYLRGNVEEVKWAKPDNKTKLATSQDVLLLWDGSNAGEFIIARDGAVSSTMALLNNKSLHQRYFFYACKTMETEIKQATIDMGIPHVNGDHLKESLIPVPPIKEQAAIATFLDFETAKIDLLIGEQQRLIDLLKEKRQAVISHAVTKGLNPDALMKDSRIEWLGQVPKHWEVKPIKHIVAVPITDGPHETPCFYDEGVPFVSAEAVSTGQINFSKIRGFISEEDNRKYSLKYSPKMHDIYMVKSGATTGITAIVEERIDFNIWSPLAVIRCGKNANPYFVLNFMRSKNFLEAITLNWSFGTQQNIGMGVIENLPCAIPPINEQISIAEYLISKTNNLDCLTSEAQNVIALLQDRRQAIIFETVTGKIDVRKISEKG